MTDDLVKRLRSNRPIPTLPHEAADRIEALTAALVEIRTCTTEHGGAAKALRIINAALEKKS